MEDSDEDFTELCTKVLRRVKKAEGEDGHRRDIGAPRARGRLRRGAGGRRGPDPGSKRKGCGSGRASQAAVPPAVCPAPESDPPGAPPAVSVGEASPRGVQGPGRMGVKEKVVRRLQRFKRLSPERLTHTDLGTGRDRYTTASGPGPAVVLDPQRDEALACQLQEALQREALDLEGLEEGGLFFCQICQKDLSAMNSLRRTQHLNRCLDDTEASAPPSSTGVPECPICGKQFRHPKTRAAHLKRCASEMGVPPAQLLEAIKRQAEDQGGNTARPHPPGVRSKRRGAGDPGRPAKRPRKQAEPLDEDTMLALALSRSMAEEEEVELRLEPPGKAPGVQGRPTAGRRRRKAAPGPLPLLLAQDPEAARRRLQERAAALLLREWPSVPPGPGLPASALRAERGGVGLWERSALRDVDRGPAPAFYSRELVPPIEPWAPAAEGGAPRSPAAELETQPVTSDPGGVPSPQRSQTLCDLMELADEGLTLTQWGLRPAGAPGAAQDRGTDTTVTDLPLSGFVPTAENMQAAPQGSVAQCQLVSDLAGMVNNPQLSDVQFQTDSGDVLFAHSFMLYARCPLLVQLVHDEGFSVEEEAMPPARRVLLGEVPPEAARLLLQYLYTARCALSPALAPPLQDLAARFGLKELEELCRDAAASGGAGEEVEARLDSEEECSNGDRNFQELLRSMWVEEEEDGQGLGRREEGPAEGFGLQPETRAAGDEDPDNERVGEEELEEIYEFAATQGRTVGRSEGESEEEEEDEECLNTGSEDAWKDRRKEEECVLRTGCPFSPQRDRGHLSTPPGAGGCESKQSQVIHPSNGSDLGSSVSQTRRREGAGEFESSRGNMDKGNSVTAPVPVYHEKGRAALDTSGASVPGRDCEKSLDKSYDRIFSESWGDYVEPSQEDRRHTQETGAGEAVEEHPTSRPNLEICETASREDLDPPSDSESSVIDLSVSPAQKPGDASSFPFVGSSPISPLEKFSGARNATLVDCGRTSSKGSILTNNLGICQNHPGDHLSEVSRQPDGTGRTSVSSSKESSTPRKTSQGPTCTFSQRDSSASKPVDIIVLLDSDEEMEFDPGREATTSSRKEIKTSEGEATAHETSSLYLNHLKEEGEKLLEKSPENPIRPEREGDFQLSPEVSSPDPNIPVETSLESCRLSLQLSSESDLGHEDSTSMETSWMIPGTPVLPVRTRHESTQTPSTMGVQAIRRTNLFRKSSRNEPGLFSSGSLAGSREKSSRVDCSETTGLSKSTSNLTSAPAEMHQPGRRRHSSAESPTLSESKGSFQAVKSISRSQISPQEPSSAETDSTVSRSPSRLSLSTVALCQSQLPSLTSPPSKDFILKKSSSAPPADESHGSARSQSSPETLSLIRTRRRSSTDGDVSCKSSEHSESCSMGSPSSLDVSESDRIQGSGHSSRISKGRGREVKITQSTGSLKLSSLKYSPERKSFESQSNSSTKMAEPGVNRGCENSAGALLQSESDPQALASRRSPATAVFEVEESDEDGHSPPRPDHSFCLDEEPPLPFEMSWSAPRSSEFVRSSPLGTIRDAVSPEKSPPSSQPNPTQQPQAVVSMEDHPSLLDSKIWDVWEQEEEEEDILPLSQRVPSIALSQRVKELKTPVAPRRKARGPVVPITPMPSYSDMDTPELKAKLNRFGVRPLPKRQMVLKLKEIHQYTHQLTSSDSEDEALAQPAQPGPVFPSAASSSEAPRPQGRKPLPGDVGSGRFEEPGRGASPGEAGGFEGAEQLPALQGSTASSATASEDSFSSQRSNPEECGPSGDEDEEEGFTPSQAAVREADKIEAVRRFITSDPELHRSVLLYQPLVLSQLQAQLQQAGIRLGAAKLLDFLDSQCITFTTAKPGQPRGHRRRQRGGKSGRHRGAGKGGE
nr:PREDICTED: structure-specific endonuclease subunit SLX4 isoform X1 [Lepisosteus oculatus]XP_015215384.1 PREDICTED: structure-specific endonuclease subunit SLX4 isoform X1 [Lepisosteus oculatus]XP_015215386.1 PREDICTED: structure-specific endonuclease subunit SLX4 isoform X1 [Lepisosteus oculatus]